MRSSTFCNLLICCLDLLLTVRVQLARELHFDLYCDSVVLIFIILPLVTIRIRAIDGVVVPAQFAFILDWFHGHTVIILNFTSKCCRQVNILGIVKCHSTHTFVILVTVHVCL
jgi:hypothetical protein